MPKTLHLTTPSLSLLHVPTPPPPPPRPSFPLPSPNSSIPHYHSSSDFHSHSRPNTLPPLHSSFSTPRPQSFSFCSRHSHSQSQSQSHLQFPSTSPPPPPYHRRHSYRRRRRRRRRRRSTASLSPTFPASSRSLDSYSPSTHSSSIVNAVRTVFSNSFSSIHSCTTDCTASCTSRHHHQSAPHPNDPPIRLNRLHGANHSCLSSLSPDAHIQFARTAPFYRTASLDRPSFTNNFVPGRASSTATHYTTRENPVHIDSQTHFNNEMMNRKHPRKKFYRGQGRDVVPLPSEYSDDPVIRHRTRNPDRKTQSRTRGHGRQFHDDGSHLQPQEPKGRQRANSWDNQSVLSRLTESNNHQQTTTPTPTSSHHQNGLPNDMHILSATPNYYDKNPSNENPHISLSPSDELLVLREAIRAMERNGSSVNSTDQSGLSITITPTQMHSPIERGETIISPILPNKSTSSSATLSLHPSHIRQHRPDRTATNDNNRPNRRYMPNSVLANSRAAGANVHDVNRPPSRVGRMESVPLIPKAERSMSINVADVFEDSVNSVSETEQISLRVSKERGKQVLMASKWRNGDSSDIPIPSISEDNVIRATHGLIDNTQVRQMDNSWVHPSDTSDDGQRSRRKALMRWRAKLFLARAENQSSRSQPRHAAYHSDVF